MAENLRRVMHNPSLGHAPLIAGTKSQFLSYFRGSLGRETQLFPLQVGPSRALKFGFSIPAYDSGS